MSYLAFTAALLFFMGWWKLINWVGNKIEAYFRQKKADRHFEKTERYYRGFY